MKAVIQRIQKATVYVDGCAVGSSGHGLYLLLGVENGDTEQDAALLAAKITKLRIFCDEAGKMNLSVLDVGGEALVVSNFTLNADYSHGNRPSYFDSAPPAEAERLYLFFTSELSRSISHVGTGRFGADMKTEMVTDGPVTIVMSSKVLRGGTK